MDIWTPEKRSEVMGKIRSSNTKPEILVRKALHQLGYRFGLNKKSLPGKPDIVLTRYNTVIFVDGCFWHFHQDCRDGKIPQKNRDYWEPKLKKNKKRDEQNSKALAELGWKILTIWECDIKKDFSKILEFLGINLGAKIPKHSQKE